MKVKFIGAFVAIVVFITGCSETTNHSKAQQTIVNANSNVLEENCDLKIDGIHFTKSLNNAINLVQIEDNGKINFKVGSKKDFFSDPDEKLSNNTAPILLSKIDNKKPFTLTAKVTPQFTEKGTYNAGVLYLYADEKLYQKYCFEQDEDGDHRMVTVRTKVTSDDNNHDIIKQPFVYMKISSDSRTIGSYYSLDNKTWKLVRLYKNEYPKELFVGISTQCPVDTGTISYFENIKLDYQSIKNFRLGI